MHHTPLTSAALRGGRRETPLLPWFSSRVTTNTPVDTREVPHKKRADNIYVTDRTKLHTLVNH